MKMINGAGNFINEELAQVLEDVIESAMEVTSPIRKVVKVKDTDGYGVVSSRSQLNKELQVYNLVPMVQPRYTFSIKKEDLEMMNASIEPYQLDELEEAAKKIAAFEENLVLLGIKEAGIEGVLNSEEVKTITISKDPEAILGGVLSGAIALRKSLVQGPYNLIMGRNFLEYTAQISGSKTVAGIIEDELGEENLVSASLDGAVLIPKECEDIHLNIKEELMMGVQAIEDDKIVFFLTEILNLTINKNDVAVRLKIKK